MFQWCRPVLPTLLVGLLPFLSATPGEAQTHVTEHTVTLDEGRASPPASLDAASWLTGRWKGTGLGADVEEVWMPPAGGAMAGVYRMVRGGAPELYEIVTLVERDGSLVLRLKHFDEALVGWEEKDETVDFPLVRIEPEALWFDGLTIRREGRDRMRIWVALGSSGGEVREGEFVYTRVAPGDEAAAAPRSEPPPPESVAVSAAMDSVYARFTRAYALGEPDSVVVLYTGSPLYLPAAGDIRRGTDELRSQFQFLRSIAESGRTAHIEFESVDRSASGGVGYDVGYYTLQVENADGSLRPPSRGKFTTVWRRDEDGRWRIQVDSFSPAPPPESRP